MNVRAETLQIIKNVRVFIQFIKMKKEQIMIEPSNLKQFKLEQEAMEAKNNLAEILKQELTEFCYDSHGLINLVKNKNVIVRVIWLLLILTSTAYCVECIRYCAY